MTYAAGQYHFWGLETLGPNQVYYPYYDGSLGAGYLGYWYGADISAYTAGGTLAGGDMDLSPLTLVSPNSSIGTPIPVLFSWLPRLNSPNETYELYMYDPDDANIYWRSGNLGHAGTYILTGLPAGFPQAIGIIGA